MKIETRVKSKFTFHARSRCDEIFSLRFRSLPDFSKFLKNGERAGGSLEFERGKLSPPDRGSRRESTANNSDAAFHFILFPSSLLFSLSSSLSLSLSNINRNEIKREKLRSANVRPRVFRADPSSPRLSGRKDFRSRVVSLAPGTAFFESNFDARDAISIQRVCEFARSDVTEVKERREPAP